MFRFAPYAIHLNKTENVDIIVYTRSDRFDLYGHHARTFVPLTVNDELPHDCFRATGFSAGTYQDLIGVFRKKYEKSKTILDHFYPDIRNFKYRLKWQFPRMKMDYDFNPRKNNKIIVEEMLGTQKCIFLDLSWEDRKEEVPKITKYIKDYFSFMIDTKIVVHTDVEINSDPQIIPTSDIKLSLPHTSAVGCMMNILDQTLFSIGNLNSPFSHLSILKNVPLVSLYETRASDEIDLLNPLKTDVYILEDVTSIKSVHEKVLGI